MFWYAGAVGFQIVWLKKTVLHQKNCAWLDAFGFSRKHIFLESVPFLCGMFCVTNFGIALGVCTDHLVIFIQKYVENLFRICFLWIVKDTHNDNFGNVEQIRVVFFASKGITNFYLSKKLKTSYRAHKKKRWAWCFRIFIT